MNEFQIWFCLSFGLHEKLIYYKYFQELKVERKKWNGFNKRYLYDLSRDKIAQLWAMCSVNLWHSYRTYLLFFAKAKCSIKNYEKFYIKYPAFRSCKSWRLKKFPLVHSIKIFSLALT
jgi:hypothetical protein